MLDVGGWGSGPTLQGAAQQGVQLRVDLSLLLQHVEEQLVLGGAVDLGLLQPALHHLQLGVFLSRLQTLMVNGWGGGGGVGVSFPSYCDAITCSSVTSATLLMAMVIKLSRRNRASDKLQELMTAATSTGSPSSCDPHK